MRVINLKIILHLMGILIMFNGVFMFLSALVSWLYEDGFTKEILVSAVVTISLGIILRFSTKNYKREVKKKEGYIVVTLGWLLMSATGTFPYLFTGAVPDFTNAFFETISGYTTTGASILHDIESLPKGLLFWRSTTHWIGGMGIIVLAVAILPLLGVGGMQLFAAEAPGPSADKLHPRISDTARRLWLIYFGLTLAETFLLKLAGMDFFDAVNHAMSTLSTGGFSTKNASVAYWNANPMIQYIIIVFMFLAGTNFVMSYFALKGKFSKVIRNEEFRYYAGFVLFFFVLIACIIYFQADTTASTIAHPMVWGKTESAVRHALFQVLTVITTTGFVSADFTMWSSFATVVFFGLMFLGGSAGSTSGSVKVVRHILMIKNGLLEFKRTIHPSAVVPVRFNNKAVPREIIFNVMAFFMLYMLCFIIGAVILGALGLDIESALGGAASSLGNIGPAFGTLGPTSNFEYLPAVGKWWCSFLMLLGRLELFTVLILFTPFFWRNR